jgi:PAS domain S-box-containing protein
MRSMAAAPLIAGDEVLGALGAFSSRSGGFSDAELALLRALSDHAASSIANQRLIARLARSQEELAHRVEAQRTLAGITAAIASIRDPNVVLQEVVDAARRLLGSDGAHIALMESGGHELRPSVMAGGTDERLRRWFSRLRFPVGGGINGLAARDGCTVANLDNRVDPRKPPGDDDQRGAKRMGLRGMAAAPRRAPGGEVIGTLAVSFEQPHTFSEDDLELLGGLSDQGAIAIANARLVESLSDSEARFRHLVTSSPDLVWETDATGRFTFLSPRLLELTGWEPRELVGQPWSALVEDESMATARKTWEALQRDPDAVEKSRFLLRRKDGDPIPAEVYAIGSQRDGAFVGAHGSIRDLSDAERLTEQLRRQADELADRVDAQRTLAEMAAQLTTLRDPADALKQTLKAAVRLLKGHGGQIGMITTDPDGTLRWGDGHSLVRDQLTPFTKDDRTPVDEGVSGRAVRERRASWTDDYLSDESFPHEPNSDRIARRLSIRSVMAAPLIADDQPIGAIGV